ncbi:alpha/beta fold hydrolase [Deinococcus hohokamensis]|uniref:Alpha/beta fold hydrolase n=1 Tax=Deinococcus hohokamensis TaxID=309883 RepID=A0ABV9I707_9DEIO
MTLFTVQQGAASLAGEQAGQGVAVVFLHAGVADRRMWRRQLGAFAATHQVVAYDRRGFGETQAAPEPHSPAEDLLAVLDSLNIGRAVLVGCSQGGKVALDFVLAHPERALALVLVAPAVSGAPAPDELPAPVEALLEALEEAEASGDLERLNALEARIWLDGVLGSDGRVQGEARDLFLAMNSVALSAGPVGEERPAGPAWPRLGEVCRPTLVLYGDLDFPHVQERCEALAREIPGAGRTVLSGTAHLPNLESPEAFDAALAAFLGGL